MNMLILQWNIFGPDYAERFQSVYEHTKKRR